MSVERVSAMFLQLLLQTVVSSLPNSVQKIALKEVDFTGNCFDVVSSYLRRYVSYDRAGALTCLSITRTQQSQ